MATVPDTGGGVPKQIPGGKPDLSNPLVVADAKDSEVIRWFFCIWAAIIGAMLLYRWGLTLHDCLHRRRESNSSSSSRPNAVWAKFKRHIVSAPLVHKRHSRDILITKHLNLGNIPARLPTLFLLGYLVMNVVFCVWAIDWHANMFIMIQVGRNRVGKLATVQLIPLFILAGRNNPLLWLLGISYDTANLVHRWIGRIVVLEAVVHGAFWLYGPTKISGYKVGWQLIKHAMATDRVIMTGTIACFAFMVLMIQSPAVLRRAFYETFLHAHVVLAIIAVVTLWMHLKGIAEKRFVKAIVILWALERGVRFMLLVRNSWRGLTKAHVKALPGDAMRVTLQVKRAWKLRPGQHVFLFIPGIGMWTNHPFSLAWSDEVLAFSREASSSSEEMADLEKTLEWKGVAVEVQESQRPPVRRRVNADTATGNTTSLSLLIRRRKGFTDALYLKALRGKKAWTAFIEGPYGGGEDFRSYGTVLLVAAGVGVTHQMPHLRALCAAADGSCATRRLTLVWIVRFAEDFEWIRPWIAQVQTLARSRDLVLTIKLFVTRQRSEQTTPDVGMQMIAGRPDVGAVVSEEQAAQVGAMVVCCCGTGSLSDDLRKAVRDRQEKTAVDYYEQSFSW